MSPLALLYILFASSPLLNNWHHESTFPSTWNAMPFEHESFEHYTPSFWGAEESTYTPEHLNWLLRKAVRSTEERYPTSIRSIIAEMTGRRSFFNEEPRMFESTESVRPIVHLIRRIAEVNPIMIEKILSCPITRRYVEKVLRNVEPETLYMVEKMIRKNVPVNIREKVVRRVLKNLLTKSSVFGARRSILSEMYPTEESIFSTRRSEEVVLAKIIRKLIKNIKNVSPVEELFSTRHFNVESIFGEKSYKQEQILSKVLSKLIKSVAHKTHEHKSIKSVLKAVLRNAEVTPFSTRKNVEELCYKCEAVCESSSLIMSPVKSFNKICRVCEKVCPMTSTFTSEYEQPIFGRWSKLSKLF